MTDIDAMKLALKALETEVSIDWTNNDEFNASAENMHEAITALKERLAQPEQTEVQQLIALVRAQQITIDKLEMALADHPMRDVQRLGQEIEQEPPQRTWVGLTEQEHTDIAVECGCMSADWVFYGAAVERKVKERNT